MFKAIWDQISGRASARKTLDAFVKEFPGRCPICSFHNYGFQHGFEKSLNAKSHSCLQAHRKGYV